MNAYKSNSEIIAEYRRKFLFLDANETPIDLTLFKGKYVIYVIVNIKTRQFYIGKTTNLLNRSNHYIWSYRNKCDDTSRPVIHAILSEGIENFRMYPIYISKNREELAKDEVRFVSNYMTITPNLLYNKKIPSESSEYHTKLIGYKTSISTKIKKAKWCIAINPDTKRLYLCTGMKIFGDLVGSSKDQVKNCTRRGIRHHGFYIFYFNDYDRQSIVEKRREAYKAHLQWKKANKPNFSKATFEEYLDTADIIEKALAEKSLDSLINLGYICEFLTYNDSNKFTDKEYKVTTLNNFSSFMIDSD